MLETQQLYFAEEMYHMFSETWEVPGDSIGCVILAIACSYGEAISELRKLERDGYNPDMFVEMFCLK